jgi:hypothetical protein
VQTLSLPFLSLKTRAPKYSSVKASEAPTSEHGFV